jgi:hypothetical protein
VMSLTQSISKFTASFQTYYPPPHGGDGGKWSKLG